MANILTLKSMKNINVLSDLNSGQLYRVYPIRLNKSVILGFRYDNELIGFEYKSGDEEETLQLMWRVEVANKHTSFEVNPIWVTDLFSTGNDVVILRHPHGLRFYQPEMYPAMLRLLAEDLRFSDGIWPKGDGQFMISGRFYPNRKFVGVICRNKGLVQFYYVKNNIVSTGENNPLWELKKTNYNLFSNSWSSDKTVIFLSEFQRDSKDAMILQTSNGLEVYKFNKTYNLEKIYQTSFFSHSLTNDSAAERLIFANLTNQSFRDILSLNNSGLFTYQYDANKDEFLLIHKDYSFSKSSGWLAVHSETLQLTDLNGDGLDDILFSGPKGLTGLYYDSNSVTWRPTITCQHLPFIQQYVTNVGVVLPPFTGNPLLFTQDAYEKVYWYKVLPSSEISSNNLSEDHEFVTAQLNEYEEDKVTYVDEVFGSGTFLDQGPMVHSGLPEKTSLRWVEQREDNFLQDAIDISKSQISFRVPLIEVDVELGYKVEYSMEYNSHSMIQDILGLGWSTTMMDSYIVVVHGKSVFKEDIKYFIMTKGKMSSIQPLGAASTERRFESLDQKDIVNILFREKYNTWEVENTRERCVYGRRDEATVWSLGWRHWRGAGRNAEALEPLPVVWYLTERHVERTNITIHYHYENIMTVPVPGAKAYTTSIKLREVFDNRGMSIVFNYAPKESYEYTNSKPVDSQGNIRFPVKLVDSSFLTNYTVTTASYFQTIRFQYDVDNKQRRLTKVEQCHDHERCEVILRFEYERILKNSLLTRCHLPRGRCIGFKYELSSTMNHPLEKMEVYSVHDKPSIVPGPGYNLLYYKSQNNDIVIKELKEKTTDIILNMSSEKENITNISLHAYNNYFVALIKLDTIQKLCFFNRKSGSWSQIKNCCVYNADAFVRFAEDTIAVGEFGKYLVKVIRWNRDSDSWNETAVTTPSVQRLAIMNNRILGYSGQDLWMMWQNKQDKWETNILVQNLINFSASEREAIYLFDLKDDLKATLLRAWRQQGLQVFSNVIFLSGLEERNNELSSPFYLFLLDEQYNVVKQSKMCAYRENLLKISQDVNYENTTFNLHYLKDGGLFKVRVKELSGNILKDLKTIGNRNLRKDAKDNMIRELNKSEGWRDFFLRHILFSWGHHCGALQQDLYTDIAVFKMTGDGWVKEPLPRVMSIPLGSEFVLESYPDNQTCYRLYKQNDVSQKKVELYKINAISPTDILFRYPAYIAHQTAQGYVKVITFKDSETLGAERIFENETMLFGDMNILVSFRLSSVASWTKYECLVRPVSSLLLDGVEEEIIAEETIWGNINRTITYERTFKVNMDESTYSKILLLIPTGNKTESGWYEHAITYSEKDKKPETITKTFDASGQEIIVPFKQREEGDTNNELPENERIYDGMIWDRSGEFLISNFFPFSLAEGHAAYFGFESYEVNQIGLASNESVLSETKWIFPLANIKSDLAFTGENYLHLDGLKNDSLVGVLQPNNQDTYIASCWLRYSERLSLGDIFPMFKAILLSDNGEEVGEYNARVKRMSGDWAYMEILIDFTDIKEIYNSKFITNGRTRFKVKIQVQVDSKIKIIDLDHIRFSSISHKFEATVYQPITGKSIATIQGNGLVTRFLYNRYSERIATLREDGQIYNVISSSKTGRLFPNPHGMEAEQKQLPGHLELNPESGFHEIFDGIAWKRRWKMTDTKPWRVKLGQLRHQHADIHRIEANKDLIDKDSFALHFTYFLNSSSSMHWLWTNNRLTLARLGEDVTLSLAKATISPLPLTGELVLVNEKSRIILWIDGVLLFDRDIADDAKLTSSEALTSFEAHGEVYIENVLLMNRPKVKFQYFNGWGKNTQVIHLEDAQTVQVAETIYDSLGREVINTKLSQIMRGTDEPLMQYYEDFIEDSCLSRGGSFWNTGRLQGRVDRTNPEDRGFAYTRTEYERTPLKRKKAFGLPGLEFSIKGSFKKEFSDNTEINFPKNYFPAADGYRMDVEKNPNGSQRMMIYDRLNNRIAIFVHVPGYDNILSTYEYDEENRLVKILPPLYHEKVGTFSKVDSWRPGEKHLSEEESRWQRAMGTHLRYEPTPSGQLTSRRTPDSGEHRYLYDSAGQKRFDITVNNTSNETETVTYFHYDVLGQLTQTGYLTHSVSESRLKETLDEGRSLYDRDFQYIDQVDAHPDPLKRGRLKRYVTYNGPYPIVDELHFNDQLDLISKSSFVSPGENVSNPFTEFRKNYRAGLLSSLVYPLMLDGRILEVKHGYNKLGQLTSLGLPGKPKYFASFTHTAAGQLKSEDQHLNRLERIYSYNSPGFLEQISDTFLTEKIFYTSGGYGQAGFGDGIIMRTTFNSSWTDSVDGRDFRISEDTLPDSKVCVRALKRSGHLSVSGRPLRELRPETEASLPLECRGAVLRQLSRLLAEKRLPRYYGHTYAYGNHQELVKAKYFTEETESSAIPLQPDSFSRSISGINIQQSHFIWQSLLKAGFIYSANHRFGLESAVGKPGKSFLRDAELEADLKDLNDSCEIYARPIENLIMSNIFNAEIFTRDNFEIIFLNWMGLNDRDSSHLEIDFQRKRAKTIYEHLRTRNHFPVNNYNKLFNKEFSTVLSDYGDLIPHIARVLVQHFAFALGESPFDVESYKIDANGNHRHFYTGFSRYELKYQEYSNRLESVNVGAGGTQEKVFKVQHDSRGNVVTAEHRGIKRIEYNPASQRTTAIFMEDGRRIRFQYDAQGERVLKRVFTADGRLNAETQYLRDEEGRVLVDRYTEIDFTGQSNRQRLTAYIYGPRGLLAFIRDGVLHSVVTDHAGSVRLVVRRGKVVAAYDYLPYGQLMRSYGHDQQAHLAYRYTGQEWDEETGLYNYHARLYDPSIGRFYQPDPQAQYFSPYKYAGNSPVSLVDPDGEFAILIGILIGLAIGAGLAYLGGAAANNRWNPKDWDFRDHGTWIGIAGGFLSGALLPLSFSSFIVNGALVVSRVIYAVSIAVGIAYINMAAANQDYNPANWKWNQPGTWNAGFQGLAAGLGLVSGVGYLHKLADKINILGSVGKNAFLATSYAGGVSMMYVHGALANDNNFAFWQWDLTNPATISSMIDGFDFGVGAVQGFGETARGIGKLSRKATQLKGLITNMSRSTIKNILRNPKNPLYKAAMSSIMIFYMASASNGNFFFEWSNSVGTYESILNGIFFGKDIPSMMKNMNIKNRKKVSQELGLTTRKEKQSWNKMSKQVEQIISKFLFENIITFIDPKFKKKSIKHGESNTDMESSSPDKTTNVKKGRRKLNMDDNFKILVDRIYGDFMKTLNNYPWLDINNKQKKLIEINIDSDETYHIKCGRARRRRQPGLGPCSVTLVEKDKKEFAEILSSATSIKDEFTKIVQATPILHAPATNNFFIDFFIGTAVAMTKKGGIKNAYAFKDQIEVDRVSVNSVQLVFVKEGKDKTTEVSTKRVVDIDLPRDSVDYKRITENILEQNILNKNVIIDVKNEDFIHTETVFLDDKNNLDFFEKNVQFEKFQEVDSVEFKEIVPEGEKFMESIEKVLENRDLPSTEEAIMTLSGELLQFYKDNESIFQTSRKNADESEFHGYVYGVLQNLKRKYKLDIRVEALSGRGYADMIIMSRKGVDTNKDWNAMPIIFEFKTTRNKQSKADSGIEQIKERGYIYNLPMRTLAEKAIGVGIDSGIGITNPIAVQTLDIPKSEGFLNQVLSNNKIKIKQELKYLYYSISSLVNNHKTYLSRMTLGLILSRSDIRNGFLRLNKSNQVSTFFLDQNVKDGDISNKWTMLNIDEGYYGKIRSEVPETLKGSLTETHIQINPKKKFNSERYRADAYVEKIEIVQRESNILIGKSSDFVEMKFVDYNQMTTPVNLMEHLFEIVKPYKRYINRESDFQALLQGILIGSQKHFENQNKIIKVLTEANLSKEGRVDLTLSILDKSLNHITEAFFVTMELKYASNTKDVAIKLEEAKEQIKKYGNYEAVTYQKDIITVSAVFDKETGSVTSQFDFVNRKHNRDFNEVILNVEDIHLTDADSPENPNDYIGHKRDRDTDTDTLLEEIPPKRRTRQIYLNTSEETCCLSTDNKQEFNKHLDTNGSSSNATNTNTFEREASSQGNHLTFWPVQYVKDICLTIKDIINSFTSTAELFSSQELNPRIQVQPKLKISGNAYIKPDLLEMGDRLVERSDVQGNLTWAILLARKLSGKRPLKETGPESIKDIEFFTIQAADIVDKFISIVLQHSIACGITPVVRQTIEGVDVDKVKKYVFRQLIIYDAKSVPQFMFEQIVIKIKNQLVKKASHKQTSKLINLVIMDLPDMQRTLLNEEQTWLSATLRSDADHLGLPVSCDKWTPQLIIKSDNIACSDYKKIYQNNLENVNFLN